MTSIANVACHANVAYQATVAFCGEGSSQKQTARDIPAITRGDNPFEIEASIPVTPIAPPAPAANDPHHIAAAA